jgi:hypothetical protein
MFNSSSVIDCVDIHTHMWRHCMAQNKINYLQLVNHEGWHAIHLSTT